MSLYKAIFGPDIDRRKQCVAALIGDERKLLPGKRLIGSDGSVIAIVSIGTQCRGLQPHKTLVLLSGEVNRSVLEYTLID